MSGIIINNFSELWLNLISKRKEMDILGKFNVDRKCAVNKQTQPTEPPDAKA